MGARYVEVPRALITGALEKAGFTRLPVRGEVTYERKHRLDPRLSVLVYTSVAEREDGARDCGEDAIRIQGRFSWEVAGEDVPRWKQVYPGKGKSARVYRVTSPESVVERTLARAREAYDALNRYRVETLLGGGPGSYKKSNPKGKED